MNLENTARGLNAVRSKSPLVHNITNYVVMNNTANALLAIGASPVMAHAIDEVADMVAIASSLVINIGTLSGHWIDSMQVAGKTAVERDIPRILDPVGAGATPLRTETCKTLLKSMKPTVIRGNASEIMALAGSAVTTKGVDSSAESTRAVDAARQLAQATGAVVVISGAIDYITDGERLKEIKLGSPLMAQVTGMGCTATAVIGAFAAVVSDPFEAAWQAMTLMGVAGQRAARQARGTGTMQIAFLDELSTLTAEDILSEKGA